MLACSAGPFANQGVLVRRPLDGDVFAPSLLAGANVHALSARGPTVACADDDGCVWTSANAGATWRDVGPLGARSVVVP